MYLTCPICVDVDEANRLRHQRFPTHGAAAMQTQTPDDFLNEDEAATLLGVNVSWMRRKRNFGGGPPFVRLGHLVRYKRSDLMVYVGQNTYTSIHRKAEQAA